MATIDTVYQVWYKRQNRKEGMSPQILHGTFDTLEQAREECLNLSEENIMIWKQYRITELVETVE